MNIYLVLIGFIILFIILNVESKQHFESRIIEKFNNNEFNVYLINMEKNKDRLMNFTEYYNKSDLNFKPFELFPAVVGKDLNLIDYLSENAYKEILISEKRGRKHHYDLTPGAVGCYLSHLRIYKKLVNSNYNYGIIFEDDAIMAKNTYEKMLLSLNNIPSDWDIILLGVLCIKCDTSEKYIKISRFWGTHGYLIKKQSAVKLLEFLDKPLSKQIDADMSLLIKRGLIKVYGINPILVSQDTQFGSEIQSHVIDSEEVFNEEFAQKHINKIYTKKIIDDTYREAPTPKPSPPIKIELNIF